MQEDWHEDRQTLGSCSRPLYLETSGGSPALQHLVVGLPPSGLREYRAPRGKTALRAAWTTKGDPESVAPVPLTSQRARPSSPSGCSSDTTGRLPKQAGVAAKTG